MRTIHKYPLTVTDDQTVGMPLRARILSVAVQRGNVVLYALVDPDAPGETRRIRILGTGLPFPDAGDRCVFIGTVMVGAFVWHVFEKTG